MTDKNKETALALTADFATVYASVYGGEFMKPVKATFTLSEKKGHFYTIGDKTVISSTGYIQLNKAASVNIVTPKTVVVDGKEENNPYIERHGKTRAIESVAVRKIGIGFSPIGNMTVIDKTLFYNVYTYLIQSIQAKMKARKWKTGKNGKRYLSDDPLYPNCAKVGTEQDKPTDKGKWTFFLTADPLGIWVDYTNDAILACLEEHTQRQRFGDRIAQKICERNILRDHPAIGVSSVDPQKNIKEGELTAKATVYAWRHEMNPQNLDDILHQAEQGAKEIDIKAETVEPTRDEEKDAIEEEEKTDEIKPKTGSKFNDEPPDDYDKQKAEKGRFQKNLNDSESDEETDGSPAKTSKSS